VNICFSVIGKDFADFVREQIENRKAALAERQDLNVAVDPEFLEVIRQSTAISTQKGNSAHLLKIGSKRRRTRAEILEHRARGERASAEVIQTDARITNLQEQLLGSKSQLRLAQRSEELVREMMAAGVLVE